MTETLLRANAGPRMDRLPLSPWHYRLVALIASGMFIDAFEIYSGGAVLASMLSTGWSTLTLNATFVSVTMFGLVCGAWLAGVLGDRFGRRFCYQANLALFGVSSVLAAFAPNMEVLIGLRFLMGIGLGAEIVVGYGTLTEFLPKASRGRVMTLVGTLVNTSFFLSYAIAYLVIPVWGWRAMFLLPGLAALGIWLARKSLPESPRWLESKGRTAEAVALLDRIKAEITASGRTIPSFVPAEANTTPVSVRVLFSPGVLRNTMIGMLVNVAVNFTLYGFLQWLPSVFVRDGMALGTALQIAMVLGLGKSVGGLLGMGLADRLGRKGCTVIFSVAAAALGTAMIYTHGAAFLVTVFLLSVCLGLTNSIAFSLYVPELFETRFRLRGSGLCNSGGRLSSAGLQYAIPPIVALAGLSGLTFALSSVLLLQAVVVGVFGIETRRKALDNPEVSAHTPDAALPGANAPAITRMARQG
jgi:putative MFS transporter